MIRRVVLISSLTLAAVAEAQSTESLRRTEHSIALQAAAGGTSGLFRSYGRQVGPMRAANLSIQGRTEDAVFIRGDLWALHAIERSDYYTFVSQNTPPVPNGYRTNETFAIAIGVSPVFRLNLPGDISIEAALGGGFVPYARGLHRNRQFTAPAFDERRSDTAAGWYVSPGLAIRWWHFVAQQHMVQLLGVDEAVYNGENAPLTLGFRW